MKRDEETKSAQNGTVSSPTRPVPPPTLRPFLDNLPSPASLTSSNPTPPAVLRRNFLDHDQDNRTPTRASFELVRNDEDNEEDEDNETQQGANGLESHKKDEAEEDKEESEEEDAEFQSHYSRQSSPATSSDIDSEDDQMNSGAYSMSSINGIDDNDLNPVHRVNSLPASASHHHHGHAPPLIHSHSYSNIHPLHLSRSSASLSRGPPPLPPPLYPPFYNKPPTPLPPSPSLTSLLRPASLLTRSIPSTRPTSPDSSDHDHDLIDTPHDTESQITSSARRTQPLPPTAPKVPTYEYYGFVLYLASSLAFLMYILWAYLPSPFLRALGVTYYPDRWWALAIPAWIVMALVWIYVALAAYNLEFLTLGLTRVETMVDEHGNVAILDEKGRVRVGGSKRYVRDVQERRKRELLRDRESGRRNFYGSHGKGSGRSSGKKKRDRERERDRDRDGRDGRDSRGHDRSGAKDDMYGYGYMGEVREDGGGVASGLSWGRLWNEGTDAVMDVPLGGVCEVLYGDGRVRV